MVSTAWKALAMAAAALLASGAAWAGVERQPPTGDPAMRINVPDGWKVDRDDSGNIYVFTPQSAAGAVLIIEAAPAGTSRAEFAASAFKIAGCAKMDRTEPARLGGLDGEAFFCRPSQTELLPLRSIVVRLDSGHMAVASRLANVQASAADVQAVDDMIATVRFEGAGH